VQRLEHLRGEGGVRGTKDGKDAAPTTTVRFESSPLTLFNMARWR
jgi:hypothetical protein